MAGNNQEMPTSTLIDCRAKGVALIVDGFAWQLQIQQQEVKEKKQDDDIDGWLSQSASITNIAHISMNAHDQGEQLPLFVTKLGHDPILPIIHPLPKHYVALQCSSNTVFFPSQDFPIDRHDSPITVQWVAQ
jgi:hypothetical protein